MLVYIIALVLSHYYKSRYIAVMYNTMMHAEQQLHCFRPDFAFTNDTPYLALTGELWSVFREIRDISSAHCILYTSVAM